MTGRIRLAAAVIALGSGTLPSDLARASPARVLEGAHRSVVVVDHPSGATTAFAFGAKGGVVTVAGKGRVVRAVTSAGSSISGEVGASRDGLAAARVSSSALRGLLASRARRISPRTLTYALGPPLGYGAERVRRVEIPATRLTSGAVLTVPGVLPHSFAGAPVVTDHGAVVGAVALAGGRSWRFVPLSVVNALTAPSTSQGVPWFPIVLGAVIVFLGGVAFGLLRAKRRREREGELRLRQHRARKAAKQRSSGPLVRLRGTAGATADTEDLAVGDEEDFEVIVKPHQDDS